MEKSSANNKNNIKEITILGILLAIAILVGYIEVLFPLPIAGMKLGLANAVVLIAMYKYSNVKALIISLLRVGVIGILFGNIYSLSFAYAGAISSYTIMVILKKNKNISITFVSVIGAIFHILGQIIVAYAIIEHIVIFYYLPVLLIVGIITGYLVGVLTKKLISLDIWNVRV